MNKQSAKLDAYDGFLGINLACGGKLCNARGWINADHNPSNKSVQRIDLRKRIPYQDNTFDVVYHSQFIEHLPYEKGLEFLKECFRILKPNGVIRVVTPDLQNQTKEYLENLQALLANPRDEVISEKYYWIRLEMLDQLTRHTPGGEMIKFLNSPSVKLHDYLRERLGRSAEMMLGAQPINEVNKLKRNLKLYKGKTRRTISRLIPRAFSVGKFRLSGETHLCIYDRFLLSKALCYSGFSDITHVSANESRIPNWEKTLLDSDINGSPDCQKSLFMEATKQ
ncbi:class I SAM-dependent methyltransferase [Legionella impletisoli]|uniref:Methyltransferase type 11 domain-containing protein n=1 Tax=Legionella impletisoli TaxID=343510 RepID=A0A917NA50_9GAMM|nr:methyltransferase domain-containing protein [Legionella impletisoli]GGI82068.1 hypothetical protein GCM10007966_08320 [Legionella impletisoli]